MNLMPEIIKKLGVEIGEKFDVTDAFGNIAVKDVMFSEENGSLVSDHFTGFYIDTLLVGILKGEGIVLKRPWKPKVKQDFYYVTKGNELGCSFWCGSTFDIAMLLMGNVFRTKEEITDEIKRKLVKKMQEAGGNSE